MAAALHPANAGLRLYGGAAVERCMHELQVAADALTLPKGEGESAAGRQAEEDAREDGRKGILVIVNETFYPIELPGASIAAMLTP